MQLSCYQTKIYIKRKEYGNIITQKSNIPLDTRLTVTIEDARLALTLAKRQKALEAMKKLRGSGTGNLVEILLQERQKDMRIDGCKPINEKSQYLHWVDIFPSYDDGLQETFRVVKPEKGFKTKINWKRK